MGTLIMDMSSYEVETDFLDTEYLLTQEDDCENFDPVPSTEPGLQEYLAETSDNLPASMADVDIESFIEIMCES